MSPDGKLLARGLSNGSIAVVEVETGRVVFEVPKLDPIDHVAWAHNGNGLVVGDQRGAACVWDVAQRSAPIRALEAYGIGYRTGH